ncbi:hypothetical protein HYU16_00135 [Candidatus Woesearchaeota archaeon]|nr:hypothetical protein [Candidatus Woesearchaeota archaeon]
MLSRIRELVSGSELKELAEQLKHAVAAIKEQSEQIKGLHSLTAAAKDSISEIRSSNSLMAEEARKSADAARQLQAELAKALAELKSLSSHVQGSIKQKITEDLIELTREVKAKLEGAERLKSEITTTAAAVSNELAKLKADVAKLAAVADKIKAEDFELVRFSQQLASADAEKLRLMKQIDTLELLIAKMRRQQVR